MKNQVNTIYVAASSSTMITTVSKEITHVTPKATVTTSSDLANEVTGSLASASSLARNLGKWLAIAVLAAAFLLASLLTMSAVSRRVREFGTLKALGWRSRRIVGQVLGESITIGIIGGIGGIVLGFAGAALVSQLAPPLTATTGLATGTATPGGARAFAGGGPPGGGGGFGGAAAVAVAAGSAGWPRTRPTRSPSTSTPGHAGGGRARRGAGHRGRPDRRRVRRMAGGPAASRRRTGPGGVREQPCTNCRASPRTTRRGGPRSHALAGVDLRISDGEWLAIQGPTGHGKTTLLQILGGLDRPTSGVVDFDGQNLAACGRARSPGCGRTRSASSSRRST